MVECLLLIAAAGAAAFALHRLALRMEGRGWVNYRYRRPVDGGAAGELQKVYEPPARHVYQVREERRTRGETDVPGGGDG